MSNFKTLTRTASLIIILSFLSTSVVYPAPDRKNTPSTTLRVPMIFGKGQEGPKKFNGTTREVTDNSVRDVLQKRNFIAEARTIVKKMQTTLEKLPFDVQSIIEDVDKFNSLIKETEAESTLNLALKHYLNSTFQTIEGAYKVLGQPANKDYVRTKASVDSSLQKISRIIDYFAITERFNYNRYLKDRDMDIIEIPEEVLEGHPKQEAVMSVNTKRLYDFLGVLGADEQVKFNFIKETDPFLVHELLDESGYVIENFNEGQLSELWYKLLNRFEIPRWLNPELTGDLDSKKKILDFISKPSPEKDWQKRLYQRFKKIEENVAPAEVKEAEEIAYPYEEEFWKIVLGQETAIDKEWTKCFIKYGADVINAFNKLFYDENAEVIMNSVMGSIRELTKLDPDQVRQITDKFNNSSVAVALLYFNYFGYVPPDIETVKVLYHGSPMENIRKIISVSGGYIDARQSGDRGKREENYFSFNRNVAGKSEFTGKDAIILEFDVAKLLKLNLHFESGISIKEEGLFNKQPVPLSALTVKSKQELVKRLTSKDHAKNQILAKALGYTGFTELEKVISSNSQLREGL